MKKKKKTRAKVLAAISVNCIWCMCICIGLHPGPLLSPFFWTSRPHLPAGTFLNTRSLRPFIFFPFRKQSVPLHRRETRQHSSPSFYASIILSFFTRLFSFFYFLNLLFCYRILFRITRRYQTLHAIKTFYRFIFVQ